MSERGMMRCAYCDKTFPWDVEHFPAMVYAQCWDCLVTHENSHLPFCVLPQRWRRHEPDGLIYHGWRWLGKDFFIEVDGIWDRRSGVR